MADQDLLRIHEFVELLAAAANSSRHRQRTLRATGVPLPAASFQALRLVHRRGSVAVNDLARSLGVDQSTASRQLRPLEELELVSRTPDPDDRRVVRISVTSAGEQVLDQVRAVALNDLDVALADLSAADRAHLAALLERFREGMFAADVDESGWAVRRT